MTSPETPSARAPLAPGTAAGVTEPMIHEVVHAFYAKVRADPELGFIFSRVIGDGWDPHLARMCEFWSSVLLMSGRFKGSPMAAHARISELTPAHFARWLHLFRQTAGETCPEPAATLFITKAEMIARSLQLGIAAKRGELPPVAAPASRATCDEITRQDLGRSPVLPAGHVEFHQRSGAESAPSRSVGDKAANKEVEQCLVR